MLSFALGVVAGALLVLPLLLWHGRRGARRAEEAALRAQRAERLAYVGTLAGGLAHEIRNPLSTLKLNLQLLAEDLKTNASANGERRLKRIDTLQREAQRLNDILEDFLRFARGRKLDLVPSDLNQVVQQVLDFQRAEAFGRGVQIRSAFGEVPPVALDADAFRQALLNLTINAEQAMPEGGDLMVRTYSKGGWANVDVIDTGSGIPADVLPRIFDAFFSTKARGTGLGLPTARRVIEEHGGTLAVHSEVGKGTCVTISMPPAASGQPQPT